MKQIILVFLMLGLSQAAYGQCSVLTLNPITGLLDCVSSGGGGSVSITATSPVVVTPSPTTGTGVISCPTCTTSATLAATSLIDFNVSNTSGTVQAIGALCSATLPCQIRVGSVVVLTLTSGATVTISGTSSNDTVYWYELNSILYVGMNGAETLTCSGCTIASGITAFPADSVPLWTTTIHSNVWDTITKAMDQRSIYSRNVIVAGQGIASTPSAISGAQTLTTDPVTVPRYFTGSGAPSGNCTAGRDFYTDTTGLNLYFCDATNTWKQANGGGSAPTTTGNNVFLPWLLNQPNGSNLWTTGTFTAATSYFWQEFTPVPMTVTTIQIHVDTAVAAKFGVIAFFDATCTKISGSDLNFSLASTGFVTVTITPITIPAGIFYYSLGEDTGAGAAGFNTDSSNGNLAQWQSRAGAAKGAFTGSNAPTGSGAGLVMPTTCGTVSANASTNTLIVQVVE